jgi:hypothetical protein
MDENYASRGFAGKLQFVCGPLGFFYLFAALAPANG